MQLAAVYTNFSAGVLGFSFAPRIKDLKRQQLYAFRKRREYEQQGYELLPNGYIKMPLIEAQWDDILRFIATIKLKETTASQLFRRLNSYSKQHPLYQALKEFGKIPKSDFILRFIDDVELRQAIEKQLNKGESANKFSKAISFGNNHDFLYGEKVEQEIADCISPRKSPRRKTLSTDRNCWQPSKTARWSVGATSICMVSMISLTRSCGIQSGYTFPAVWR